MPSRAVMTEDEGEPPSALVRRHRRKARRRRTAAEARRRSLLVGVLLLAAALSTPLAYLRCAGSLGLDLLYTWPAVLAFSAPAVVLLRDVAQVAPKPVARLNARSRSRARSRSHRSTTARGPAVPGPTMRRRAGFASRTRRA